eukprot:m.64911 g.64911  ORF g.64911 m.64911 type:complete len:155 (+) comp49756_c0_seq1:61-525(+)
MQLFVAVVLAVVLAVATAEDLDHGFGKSIAWRSFEAGKTESATSGKPLMLIIHKTWCGACKALKPKFAASEEIALLSQSFVMVNVQDDEEPAGEEFRIDGGYIPRIYYLKPNGQVEGSLYNINGNPKYKYWYSDDLQVVEGMKNAAAHFSKSSE